VLNATASDASQIPGMMATLASYEGMFGPYHPQTLGLAATLALALCSSGRQEAGRPLLQRALAELTRHYGKHHPVRIRALQAWCAVLCQERNWQAALPVQRDLLACRVAALGEDHLEARTAREDLSRIMSELTSCPEAPRS
jgi:hypothetical protein